MVSSRTRSDAATRSTLQTPRTTHWGWLLVIVPTGEDHEFFRLVQTVQP